MIYLWTASCVTAQPSHGFHSNCRENFLSTVPVHSHLTHFTRRNDFSIMTLYLIGQTEALSLSADRDDVWVSCVPGKNVAWTCYIRLIIYLNRICYVTTVYIYPAIVYSAGWGIKISHILKEYTSFKTKPFCVLFRNIITAWLNLVVLFAFCRLYWLTLVLTPPIFGSPCLACQWKYFHILLI